jgi:hypothetical protein
LNVSRSEAPLAFKTWITVLASRLSSGLAQYGMMYELHIIAAVLLDMLNKRGWRIGRSKT